MPAARTTSGNKPRNTHRHPKATATAPLTAGPISPGSTHALDNTANMRGWTVGRRPSDQDVGDGRYRTRADALDRPRRDQHDHVRRKATGEETAREEHEPDDEWTRRADASRRRNRPRRLRTDCRERRR